MSREQDQTTRYQESSLTLPGTVMLGTGVMIGAGTFALTEMKLVPHSHFGMPGSIQKHTLVYTVVLGLVLTAFFDLSRIAALGIVFYLIMDVAIHWGVVPTWRTVP